MVRRGKGILDHENPNISRSTSLDPNGSLTRRRSTIVILSYIAKRERATFRGLPNVPSFEARNWVRALTLEFLTVTLDSV